jgi:hypothetical protein
MTLCLLQADYPLMIPPATGNSDTYDAFAKYVDAGYPKTDDLTFPPGDPQNAPSEIEPDDWYIDLDEVFMWCDNGAEILQYQGGYHELADPTKTSPYWEATPESPDPQNWFEFGVVDGSHAPVEIGSFWYRSMLMGVQGVPLPCTKWYDFTRQPATNLTGIQRIISVWEFQQIQAAA